MAFCVPIDCVSFGRDCGKMYSCHILLHGGLSWGWWVKLPPFSSIGMWHSTGLVLSCFGLKMGKNFNDFSLLA